MAAGDLSTAIEAFSGAITLKRDSMVGYLMRGDAYRRRDELEAALRDLRQAAEIDPGAPSLASCSETSTTPATGIRPAADHYQAYVELDDRSPRVLYKLATGAVSLRPADARRLRRCKRRLPSTRTSPKPTTCIGLCQRDAQQSDRGARLAPEGHRARARRCSRRARSSPISTGASGARRSGSPSSKH